jgi:hypothetical protein
VDEWLRLILPVFGGVLGGWVSASLTARSKLRELQASFLLAERAKAAEDRAKNQIQYLNPLRVAAMDLRERLRIVDQRIARQDTLLGDTVIEVHDRASTASPADFASGLMGWVSLPCLRCI